jgi:hypothetical protein
METMALTGRRHVAETRHPSSRLPGDAAAAHGGILVPSHARLVSHGADRGGRRRNADGADSRVGPRTAEHASTPPGAQGTFRTPARTGGREAATGHHESAPMPRPNGGPGHRRGKRGGVDQCAVAKAACSINLVKRDA